MTQSKGRRGPPQNLRVDGPDGPKEIVLQPMKMHPTLKFLIIISIAFLTGLAFLWLSGWYDVKGDMADGALRGIAIVTGPLAILLLQIADRQ